MYQYADLPTFSVSPVSQQMVYSAFNAMFANKNGLTDLPVPSDKETIDLQDDKMNEDREAETDPDFPEEPRETNAPAT